VIRDWPGAAGVGEQAAVRGSSSLGGAHRAARASVAQDGHPTGDLPTYTALWAGSAAIVRAAAGAAEPRGGAGRPGGQFDRAAGGFQHAEHEPSNDHSHMSLSRMSFEGVIDPDGLRPDVAVLASGSATVSVVIPALNEAANLPHVLTRIPEGVAEVLLVDGNSADDTVEVAKAIRPDIRVLVQEGRGKGNALACGFAAATGDIIVTLDADGSTDPAEIVVFVEALLAGSDYVKGSRFRQGGYSSDITPVRSLGNHLLSITVNVLFRTRFTDLCYGYNAFWRHCLPYIDVTCDGFEVEALMNVRMARSGLIVTEVASVEHARLHGESNLRAVRDGTRVLSTILVERVRRRRVPHGHTGARSRPAELLGDA
jgi:hypothetical protein